MSDQIMNQRTLSKQDINSGFSSFLVQNMIYYNYATLCTNESHIQEYFCATYVSISHTNSVTLVESVAWSVTW